MSSVPVERSESLPSTSSGVLRDSALGNEDAWHKLTSIYGPVVYGWIRRFGIGPDDAFDVMQEVFLDVYRGLAQYDRSRGRFRSWLFAITRNATNDFRKSRAMRERAEGGSTGLDRQNALPDTAPQDAEALFVPTPVLKKTLELLKSRFHEKTWTAAWRVIIDSRDPEMVAAELGMSLPAVYTAKSRVLACLREELRGLEEE